MPCSRCPAKARAWTRSGRACPPASPAGPGSTPCPPPPSSKRRRPTSPGPRSRRRTPAARLSALRASLGTSRARLFGLHAKLSASHAKLSARRASLGTSPAKPRCSAAGVPGSAPEPTAATAHPLRPSPARSASIARMKRWGLGSRRGRDPHVPLRSLPAMDAGGRSRDRDAVEGAALPRLVSLFLTQNPGRMDRSCPLTPWSGSIGWPCLSRFPLRQRRGSHRAPRPAPDHFASRHGMPTPKVPANPPGPPQRSASAHPRGPLSDRRCPHCAGPLTIIAAIEPRPRDRRDPFGLPARAPPRSPARSFDRFQMA